MRVELVEEHPRRLKDVGGVHGPVVYASPAHVQAVQTREKRRAGIPLDAQPLENAVPVEYRHPERHEGTAAALAAPLGPDVVGEREQVEVAPGVRAKPQRLGRLRAVVRRLVCPTEAAMATTETMSHSAGAPATIAARSSSSSSGDSSSSSSSTTTLPSRPGEEGSG